MDINIPSATNVNNDQENYLLLNAIKNKFSTPEENEATISKTPKFNIPLLKIPGNTSECLPAIDNNNAINQQSNVQPTKLNQFLLKQLQEKQVDKCVEKEVEFPFLKQQSTNSSIRNLTKEIKNLQVRDSSSCPNTTTATPITPGIDLTTALASKVQICQDKPPTRDLKQKHLQNNEELDFDIPFIDCDNFDLTKQTALLANSNEYCEIDISHLSFQHTLREPSAIGRILNIDYKYSNSLPLKCFTSEFSQQSVRQNITPFLFDTKSPDDIVLEELHKNRMRHLNGRF